MQLLFLVAGITDAYSLYLLSIIFSVFMLFPVERNRNKALALTINTTISKPIGVLSPVCGKNGIRIGLPSSSSSAIGFSGSLLAGF